jgi:DNA polymerase III delta prime subunit
MIERLSELDLNNERKFLSLHVGTLEDDIKRYRQTYAKLWWDTRTEFPWFKKTYSKTEQKKIENELSRFVDEISIKIRDYSPEKDKQKGWLEDFIEGLKKCGKQILELSDFYLDSIFNQGYINSTRIFIDKAKKLDPSLNVEDVYQALRNVWIMNSLQVYLNLNIEHSDAIFAYSLIYPYTDNVLDDVSQPMEKKLSLILNLRNWLEGRPSPFHNSQEEKIFKLIKMIEKQYERDLFPRVFQSLLAIFNAQIKSLLQQKIHSLPYETDILDISFEKGGTSVLADGYLVKGNLEDDQAEFSFGYGVFLQLSDDIQDVNSDKKNNHMTIFSQTAVKYDLDKLANKLFNFIYKVVELKLDEQTENRKALKEIIQKNCYYLVLEAIGKNKAYFSKKYVDKIQSYFPVRFSYLKELRKKLKERILENKEFVVDLDLISAILLTITARTISGN